LISTLPEGPIPRLYPDNYNISTGHPADGHSMVAYIDSDWAADTTHRKSVTGITIMFAGGVIGFKCTIRTQLHIALLKQSSWQHVMWGN